MNREIKFRAWDNVKNEMFYTGEEDLIVFMFSSSGIIADEIIPDDSIEGFHAERLEHLQYMQFTGLHDKNDVEIYEGDLLKLNTSLLKLSFMGDYNFGYILHHAITGDYHCMLNVDHLKRIEVVGNIYQHPHLLERS